MNGNDKMKTIEPCILRQGVSLKHYPDVLVLCDEDIDLTIEIDLGDCGGSGPQVFTGDPLRLSVNPESPCASEVVDILKRAALAEEGLSPREIRRRQSIFQLLQLMDFVLSEVPYYQSRSAYASVPVTSVADLQAFPILTRADLRANLLELIPRDLRLSHSAGAEGLTLLSTSGSTDERLQALAGNEVATVPEAYARVWTGTEATAPVKTAILTTPRCSGTVCHLGQASFEERIADNTLSLNSSEDFFSIDRRYVEQAAEELHRFAPEILLVNPVYLHWFARKAREMDIPLPSVKWLTYSYQYCSQLQKRALEAMFRVPLLSWYACTEAAAVVGQECLQGRLHVRAEQCLVETIRNGVLAQPGELGALLITTTAARTTPLIRYQIGDVGSLVDEPCGCLLNGCPCLTLHGRAKDMLCGLDRWITTRQFDVAISDTSDLDFYACTQTDAETLRLEVIPALGQEATFDRTGLAHKLSCRLGFAKVDVRVVTRLDPIPSSLKYAQTCCAYRQAPAFP